MLSWTSERVFLDGHGSICLVLDATLVVKICLFSGMKWLFSTTMLAGRVRCRIEIARPLKHGMAILAQLHT